MRLVPRSHPRSQRARTPAELLDATARLQNAIGATPSPGAYPPEHGGTLAKPPPVTKPAAGAVSSISSISSVWSISSASSAAVGGPIGDVLSIGASPMTAALADVLGGAADDVMRTSSELPEFPDVIHPGVPAEAVRGARGGAHASAQYGADSGAALPATAAGRAPSRAPEPAAKRSRSAGATSAQHGAAAQHGATAQHGAAQGGAMASGLSAASVAAVAAATWDMMPRDMMPPPPPCSSTAANASASAAGEDGGGSSPGKGSGGSKSKLRTKRPVGATDLKLVTISGQVRATEWL